MSFLRAAVPFGSALVGFCRLVLCGSAVGQGTGGRILGRVADPTGAVLAGVQKSR